MKLLLAFAALAVGANAEKFAFLPSGVATGLNAAVRAESPLTLAMNPPEEDSHMVNSQIDALLKIENLASKAAETAQIADKQRLLNAEISKIHQIVGASRRSFLQKRGIFGDIIPAGEYTVNVHAPEENAAEIEASINALLKVENRKAAAANADFAADKQRLLDAEKGALRKILAL